MHAADKITARPKCSEPGSSENGEFPAAEPSLRRQLAKSSGPEVWELMTPFAGPLEANPGGLDSVMGRSAAK